MNEREMDAALAAIRTRHGFTALTAVPNGDRWRVHGEMNPFHDWEIEAEHAEATRPETHGVPAGATSADDTRPLSGSESHALIGVERHHAFFNMLRRAIRNATGQGTTDAGRLRPQRLVELSTTTHRELHELWDALAAPTAGVPRNLYDGLQRGQGASRRVTALLGSSWTPTQIADALQAFYAVVLADYPAERAAVLGEVARIRALTGV
jgi:hypothetical protein